VAKKKKKKRTQETSEREAPAKPALASSPAQVRYSDWRVWMWVVFALILLLASDLRLFQLDTRPPHSDEGVNFLFVESTNKQGYFPYSHLNYHGPLFFYLITACVNIFGDGMLGLRLTSIVFGILTVALCLWLARLSSPKAALLSAFFVSITPSLVFFSRYAIHETLFVFASFVCALAFYAWTINDKVWLWYPIGLSFAVLVTTKETFIIFLFALAVALLGLGNTRRLITRAWAERVHIAYSYLISVFLILFTYSAAFRWPDGIGEMFLAFPQWFGRSSSDTGHFKRFAYYLYDVLWQTEPFLVIGFIAIAIYFLIALLRGLQTPGLRALCKSKFSELLIAVLIWMLQTKLIYSSSQNSAPAEGDPRYLNPYFLSSFVLGIFLLTAVWREKLKLSLGAERVPLLLFTGLWTISSFIVYSYVQYKTVWLIINISLPATLCVSLFLTSVIESSVRLTRRIGVLAVLGTSALTFANTLTYNFVRWPIPGTDIAVNNPHPYGMENPFSYVHTSPGMLDLVDMVEAYWKKKPDAHVLVGVEGYFPLPYYFRKHQSQCGYEVPKDVEAASKMYDVMILDFYKPAWENQNWTHEYNRLSDYTESMTYFKKLPAPENPPQTSAD